MRTPGAHKWVTTDGRSLWEKDGKLVGEGKYTPKPLSRTAEVIMQMIRDKGRVCNQDLTKGQRICAMTCLVHRGLVNLIPAPDECAPGVLVYYLTLP